MTRAKKIRLVNGNGDKLSIVPWSDTLDDQPAVKIEADCLLTVRELLALSSAIVEVYWRAETAQAVRIELDEMKARRR